MKKTTSRKAARRPAKPTDLYRQITDRIVVALENGVAPWRKPWRAAAGSGLAGLPLNATTGRHYSGVNVLLLWMSAEEQGFRNNRWMTYRQAQQAGGQVRKGEKATLAVVYKDWTKQAEDREGNRLYDSDGKPLMETVPMLKPLQLFNAEQCEGLPAEVAASPEQPPTVDEDGILCPDVMNRVIRMFNATGVKNRMLPQNRAYYRPLTDEIVMPMAEQFFTEADCWSTLLHELVHSTGQPASTAGSTAWSGRPGTTSTGSAIRLTVLRCRWICPGSRRQVRLSGKSQRCLTARCVTATASP